MFLEKCSPVIGEFLANFAVPVSEDFTIFG
jgi:hypothetical protein